MTNLTYKIELYDYWSTSSGLSGGALADSLCLKDKNHLPYLPGKTVKGLFREAAEMLESLNQEGISEAVIHQVFGEPERSASDAKQGERTQMAASFFTDATFNEATAVAIGKELAPNLFEGIATTALEPSGLAKQNSLRRLQYALPCTLFGEILNVNETHKTALAYCAAFIKRLGLNRHRGYGRCKITLI